MTIANTHRIVMGSTHHFKMVRTKDGVAWNLTTATAVLRLRKPDGTTLTFTGTILDGPGGVVGYVQSSTTVFNVEGQWFRSWLITDGVIVDPTPPIGFIVTASP